MVLTRPAGGVGGAGAPRAGAGCPRADEAAPRAGAGCPRADEAAPRAGAGCPRADEAASRAGDDAGSQALEFALALPAVVLALTVLLHAALVGVDLVVAQGLAREAARTAAVDGDDAVEARLREAAGDRPVEVEVSPTDGERAAGQVVTATLRVRSRGFAAFGAEVWVPARAAMRVEAP